MRTWHIESLVVFLILATVAIIRGNVLTEWIAVFAVWTNFGYCSIAERMAERQAIKENPDVECYKWATVYFIGKEILWVILFLMLHSYSSLAGCVIFILYPLWRRYYRKYIKPLKE